MIVCDLNTLLGADKKKPLERVEIWNIEASDPFSRVAVGDICNYNYRTVRSPASLGRVILDQLFDDHPMNTRIPHHNTRQSSWALLSKVLNNGNDLGRLNEDWGKRPKGASGEAVSLTMELWPQGDNDRCKTMSTMEIRKADGGYEYSIVEKLKAPYALSAGQPIKGLVESTNGSESPWNICASVLNQLKDRGLLAEPVPSPVIPVSEPVYGQESPTTINL